MRLGKSIWLIFEESQQITIQKEMMDTSVNLRVHIIILENMTNGNPMNRKRYRKQ
jgi:hypothetical protein